MNAKDLVTGVDLLCLDAGNTVIFLDHERLAGILGRSGLEVSASALVRAEGEAKRLAEDGGLFDAAWSQRSAPGAIAWGKMVGTIARCAGLEASRVPSALEAAWREHVQKNLWCKVPEGLGQALDGVRELGVHVAIISNSEGMLDRLFVTLGIDGCFDALIDSGRVGVEKPDPAIFRIACERTGTTLGRSLHLGDTYATDVVGARNAGMATALIDPHGHYEGLYPDVPRVAGAVEVARDIVAARRAAHFTQA